jgi:hypothetical protein
MSEAPKDPTAALRVKLAELQAARTAREESPEAVTEKLLEQIEREEREAAAAAAIAAAEAKHGKLGVARRRDRRHQDAPRCRHRQAPARGVLSEVSGSH